MTALTLFELAIRSMRKNMKQYYLYFFALMMSATLYFVFAALQNDAAILTATFGDVQFASLFKASGFLLLGIAAIFMLYANSIFLKRRSREIGLYQLIGLTQNKVSLLLIIENMLLGLGALLIGIGAGALMSRLFLLILMKLIGIQGVITLTFSSEAAVQTAYVFAALIGLTIIQMLSKVYRTTLLDLFKAERQSDHPKQPNQILSAVIGLIGIALIATGYTVAGKLSGAQLPMQILIILVSTIFGTYLLFRVTIGWLFYRYRRGKNGQLGLTNSLSLAPIMHRLKANANSLTLITILSAVTLTMVAIAYSLYYSSETEARAMLPYDFILENNRQEAAAFRTELEKAGIGFNQVNIEAVGLKGTFGNETNGKSRSVLLLPAEKLQKNDIDVPQPGTAVWYKGQRNALEQETDTAAFPLTISSEGSKLQLDIQVAKTLDRYAMNYSLSGRQLVVSAATLQSIREQLALHGEQAIVDIDAYHIMAKSDYAAASELYAKHVKAEASMPDYYSYSRDSLQKFGLIIFTAGFLGLIFLIATGSILYFKQMTEAEQEKKSYTILRQLGFGEREIMGGILRKQLFVFAIPLAIGIVHSIFAIKTASALTLSDITFPAAVAIAFYTLVYFLFAALTVGYYRRIVAAAL
ncbi:FtsX-like permease family protein [Paenibacillus radicis (ex Gao et al. 2016)]|uniref:FtsX-like permease family protein n=1 Tax=Paenibacillus radicis (ex Gao et al. 2016) TaxID=1737354 RepID=UPI001E4B596D|nr:FtsX-like permease family protein [Paenibacillus radicis (ex Gao et al. 2016)]